MYNTSIKYVVFIFTPHKGIFCSSMVILVIRFVVIEESSNYVTNTTPVTINIFPVIYITVLW